MKFKILIFFVLSIHFYSIKAQEEVHLVKASMLYYISDFIIWPEENEIDCFRIGIIGDTPDLNNALQLIAQTKRLKDKPIVIKKLEASIIPEDIQILILEESFNSRAESILETCKQNKILFVTNNIDNKLYTTINFIEDPSSHNINFEVNKQNLILSDFDYDEKLLLYGGNILDIKELYQSTQRLLEHESEKVAQLNVQVLEKDDEIKLKNNSIDSLSKEIGASKQILFELSDSIKIQNQKIIEQNYNFNKTKKDLDDLNTEYKNQLSEISKNTEQLSALDEKIKNREQTIQTQSEAINKQQTKIESKNRSLLLLIVLGVALFVIGLLLFRANNIKQRYNKILQYKVDERTKELQLEILRRKSYEKELIKSERNYREIFNSSSDAIFIHEKNGKIIDVNDAMLKMYGFSKSEMEGLSIENFEAKEKSYFNEKTIRLLESKGLNHRIAFDWLSKKKNGDSFWTGVALNNSNIGGEEKVLAVVRDIDEKKKNEIELEKYRNNLEKMVSDRTLELNRVNNDLTATNEELLTVNDYLEKQKKELEETLDKLKKAQEQLVESEKMASVGTLAAGVAHEINNPLNFIQGGISALITYFENNLQSHINVIEPVLNSMEVGVQRAADIVKSLNHFSRKSEQMNDDCDIYKIIDNCLIMLQNRLKDRIEIEKYYDANIRYIKGNEGKLHQVILNVLTNAEQAIIESGKIIIRTSIESPMIKIIIKDTGMGIKKELLTKIKEPFFTTKDPGEGTGLGLSISQRIITEHKGKLRFDSSEGEGTTVSIFLPINE